MHIGGRYSQWNFCLTARMEHNNREAGAGKVGIGNVYMVKPPQKSSPLFRAVYKGCLGSI